MERIVRRTTDLGRCQMERRNPQIARIGADDFKKTGAFDMGYAKLTPVFSSIIEIGMGSPYHFAELELVGKWVPELPGYDWQDLFAESPNGRYLVLVAWMKDENNDPGFRFVVIDKKDKAVRESERIAGCCQSLNWNVGLSYESFRHFRENEIQAWKTVAEKT